MIFDIDHLGLSSINIESDSKFLSLMGYSNQFCNLNKENLIIKKPLLNKYYQYHDLSLFQKENSYGIELLNHHNINAYNSIFTPIFNKIPSELITINNEDNNFIYAKLDSLNIPVLLDKKNPDSHFMFDKVLLETTDIQESINFWEAWGFKLVDSKHKLPTLEFSSIITKSRYQILLKHKVYKINNKIDNSGFTNIALVSNSVKREWKKIKNKGYYVTDIEQLEINNKPLSIFFVEGKCCEIVEIFSINQ